MRWNRGNGWFWCIHGLIHALVQTLIRALIQTTRTLIVIRAG